MNKYKEHLDSFLSHLETFKFTSKKVIQLLNDDEVQLSKGGEYLNESAIFIRDWDNFSSKHWLVDYQRIAIYGKVEYLKELDEIKSSIYKHYLIETYESLIKFIGLFIGSKEYEAPKISEMVKKIDLNFHIRLTPFGFNTITYLYMFSKVRNAFTHNNSYLEAKKITAGENYIKDNSLKGNDINPKICQIFLKAYFNVDLNQHTPTVRVFITKEIFDRIIQFTQSYAFSIYKYYSEKEGLSWEIKKDHERLDIKTNKPLTNDQKKYQANIVEHILKKQSEKANNNNS